MATKKTFDERIEYIKEKQEKLKAQEKELRKRKSEEERKKRTRRLIEMGGIIESVLGRETEDEDKIRLLHFLKMQEKNGGYFTKAMNMNLQKRNEPQE
jgi:hypothetical protein